MILPELPIPYICDNDSKKQGKKLLGIDIKHPRLLASENSDQIIVLITIYDQQPSTAIVLQLLNDYGISDILLHRAMMQPEAGSKLPANVFGEAFHIDTADRDTLSKIAILLNMVEADGLSKELLSAVIAARLQKKSLDRDYIFNSDNRTSHNAGYFSCELFDSLYDNESIVLGGLENSDDIRHFYNILGSRLKKVYAFEASKKEYEHIKIDLDYMQVMDYNEKLIRPINEITDIRLFPYALLDKHSTMYFSDGVVSSAIESSATDSSVIKSGTEITCVSIDDTVDANEPITLIKLDIEGSELAALQGAAKTILKNKPRLLVCLYHRPDDLWEIPFFIKTLCPEYDLYIRPHHGMTTVLELHAIVKSVPGEEQCP